MAFAVRLYNFSKKRNSTAVPASGATYSQYNCTNKGVLDILNPVIVLKFTNDAEADTSNFIHKNYAYIPSFGRYYYVTGWSNTGPLWEAQLEVDPLASYKAKIGNATLYVYRSSAAFDTSLADSLYPATSQLERYDTTLDKIWTIGGANAAGAAAGSGTYVLGILSNGWAGLPGVQYYGFTADNLSTFMDYIFSDDYFTHILTEFGAIEYPEAKVAINPLQYVTSARFYPIGYSTTGSGNYVLHGGGSTFVAIGSQTITDSQVWAAAFFDIPNTQQHFRVTRQTWTLVPVSGWFHSQSTARGDWLNKAPYSRVELFFPPYGIIELNPADIIGANSVAIHLDIDVWTGTGTLTVEVTRGNLTRVVSRVTTQVGLDIPLCNIFTGSSETGDIRKNQAILNTAGSAFSLNLSGTFQGLRDIAGAYIDTYIPHLCSMGTQNGSVAPMGGTPKLMFTHQLMSADDNPGRGRPYCSLRQLSEIPGYIRADADELSIAGAMGPEVTAIREAVATGFYYE